MAKYRALKSFTGITTMKKDDIKTFDDSEQWVKDLVKHGFIEKVKQPRAKAKAEPKEEAKEPPKKRRTKKAKAEEKTE